jgi:hypothetical protein
MVEEKRGFWGFSNTFVWSLSALAVEFGNTMVVVVL